MSKLFDLGAIQTIASDDVPAYHSLSAETRQILLACFGLLYDTNNWHDYDEELTDSDIDTIDSLVSKAMDELMTFPNLTNNTRMYWDGTQVRSAYSYGDSSRIALTTSGTTPAVIKTSPDMAGLIDTANSHLKCDVFFYGNGNTLGDAFEFKWQYNYDNSGSEAWANTTGNQEPWTVLSPSAAHLFSSMFEFKGSYVTSPAWGYNSTYKLRYTVNRLSGSGTFSLTSSRAQRLTIMEI